MRLIESEPYRLGRRSVEQHGNVRSARPGEPHVVADPPLYRADRRGKRKEGLPGGYAARQVIHRIAVDEDGAAFRGVLPPHQEPCLPNA